MTAHNFTEQETTFCVLYSFSGNGTQSAKEAGMGGKHPAMAAKRMLEKDYIQKKIGELQDLANEEIVEGSETTRASTIRELDAAIKLCKEAKQFGPMVKCIELKGKSIAMFTDRQEQVQVYTTEEVLDQLTDVGPIGKALIEHIIEGRPADNESILHLVNSLLNNEKERDQRVELKVVK